MRLDKYLADMSVGTRKELKEMIRKGRVLVDGVPVKDPGTAITGAEEVTVDGAKIAYTAFEYYMLNKPAGVISASEDSRQTTVVDLIEDRKRKDLFPVGRLDKDTVGLLMITNDGDLSHRLLSPRFHVDKVYYARIAGAVTESDVKAFADGLKIDDTLTALPAKLEILSVTAAPDPVSEIEVTIREGKFHQIKRMFAARGMEVVYLKRLSMGPLVLDPGLEEGEYRPLTDEEVTVLKSLHS
ncbi:MAG: rRNA pseudouridine synthase [Eubacterium sp.]|nr:rRNA pseudouridine synthase [Eubacterium sp.]